MSSRDVVLGRIRAALDGSAPPPPVPRDYRRGGGPADLDRLVERLIDYKAVVHRCAAEGIPGTIAAIVGAAARPPEPEGVRAGGEAPGHPAPAGRRPAVVVPVGLDLAWIPPQVTAVPDHRLGNDRIAAADGVVTAAAVAVAETGTIVLDASPDQGRRVLSLLPDLHICVLRPDQVVASVPDAIARLDPARPLTWISGPSATSDIELNRVEGVHGPRNLHVILLED